MRRIVSFSFMTFLFMLLAIPAQAQDVSGAWTLSWMQAGRQGGAAMERTMDVTFVQDGSAVTGTVTMAAMGRGGRGGGGAGGAPREIALEGTMEGNVLTFSYTMGMGERSFTQSFTATVDGNAMEGTMTGGMRQTGETPFKGVKKEG